MPKNVNVLPNLRIDIPDFNAATKDLCRSILKQNVASLFLDRDGRVFDGFRVQIADQTTSPGLFTVFNGIAFNRDGQILHNEDEENASRSSTLGADATYYVEVEFTESASDVDARAFWDPTYENGNDPSGDPRPDGREYAQNVATRITPDWRIVTPISTSGFALTATPGTLRIPVCVLVMSGGQIAGGTTVPAQSLTREDVGIAATALSLLDTRVMPDSFTLRLDPGGANQEDVTITANDRANNTLTVSGGTANAHTAGTRAEVAGATPEQFLIEKVLPSAPGSSTGDERIRLFQGDEEHGRIIGLDPGGVGESRSDVEVKNLKRYVDFLAGQIREIKFGGASLNTLGKTPPNYSFGATPRYYDRTVGIFNSRVVDVTIGDGSTSWGDLNTNQYASSDLLLSAAIAALPAGGGVIYIKPGVSLNNFAAHVSIPADTVVLFKSHLLRDASSVTINTGQFRFNCASSSRGFVGFERCTVQINDAASDGCFLELHTGVDFVWRDSALIVSGGAGYIEAAVRYNAAATLTNLVEFSGITAAITLTGSNVPGVSDRWEHVFSNGTTRLTEFIVRNARLDLTYDDSNRSLFSNTTALFRLTAPSGVTDYFGTLTFDNVTATGLYSTAPGTLTDMPQVVGLFLTPGGGVDWTDVAAFSKPAELQIIGDLATPTETHFAGVFSQHFNDLHVRGSVSQGGRQYGYLHWSAAWPEDYSQWANIPDESSGEGYITPTANGAHLRWNIPVKLVGNTRTSRLVYAGVRIQRSTVSALTVRLYRLDFDGTLTELASAVSTTTSNNPQLVSVSIDDMYDGTCSYYLKASAPAVDNTLRVYWLEFATEDNPPA